MKIFCIGRNYVDHAKELNNPVPSEPLIFMKPPTALLLANRPFYHPDFTQDLHYEGEIVLRICKNGRSVQPEFAARYFDAVAFGIDFTARDVQDKLKSKGHPWEIAKGFDRSAPLSQFVLQLEVAWVAFRPATEDFDFLFEQFLRKVDAVLLRDGIVWILAGRFFSEEQVAANHLNFDVFHLLADVRITAHVQPLL